MEVNIFPMDELQGTDMQEIKLNIRQIMTACDSLKEEKSELLGELASLRERLQTRDHEIAELEKRNKQFQLSGAFLSDNENATEAKDSINRIVREIDKCIALLNR